MPEQELHLDLLAQSESVFALSNGHIGLNDAVTGQSMPPLVRWAANAAALVRAITAREVPIASAKPTPIRTARAGAIKKPPPTP